MRAHRHKNAIKFSLDTAQFQFERQKKNILSHVACTTHAACVDFDSGPTRRDANKNLS